MWIGRVVWLLVLIGVVFAVPPPSPSPLPRRILLDTDVDTDDFFALLYILKLNQSDIDLEAITISTNAWTNAGHAVNQVYDLLYMMGRNDIPVGVGGEGGILQNGTILGNVGGYLPIIEQGISTAGNCRYRQSIPVGLGGRLDVDANYGIRRSFLPQVFHSGIPVTLVPLDATNTIPITKNFFEQFERNQDTYEAQYIFQSLKLARDTWFDDQFYTSYFMWDSFTSGVAASIMRNLHSDGENEFAEMEYINITVVTSNPPYGVSDGSNPFFSGSIPKFKLQKHGVHSGHVQMGIQDPTCLVKNGKGKCQDGYTKEVTGPDGVRVLVATKAKPNQDTESPLDREFFKSFLDVLNLPLGAGRFNFTTQYPYYKEVMYKPDFGSRKLGKPVVFDMDMSAGDFISLIYLLKVPVEVIDLKGILVSATGWANAATIDVIYDILHMMGRDDIPVGRGEVFAMGQPNPSISAVGDCKYIKAIPHGSGGFLDSDTVYGFARELPRSPRRYSAENAAKYGAPRDTEHPELRQPLAMEVWESIAKSVDPGSKITILTNGPLSNLAQIILSKRNITSLIQNVYVMGGHISSGPDDTGNVFSVPSNDYAEFNMFLDPMAAKTVLESKLDITLIPLSLQRRVSSFPKILSKLQFTTKTPEAVFVRRLLSRLYSLQRKHHRYHHMEIFLGEILGAVILASDHRLNPTLQVKSVRVIAMGDESTDGRLVVDGSRHGRIIKILENVEIFNYYDHFANLLGDKTQSAVVSSFNEQKRIWSTPPNHSNTKQ